MSERPALSAHVAHVLETESPLHAWTFHRLLGGKPKPSTDPQVKGSILHNLLLEGGSKIVEIDADAYRSNAAKEARDAALEAGLLPCLTEKLADARACVERWLERFQEIRIHGAPFSLYGGDTEVSLEWDDQGALCHGRADWINKERTLVVDLKTTEGSAAPGVCATSLLRTAAVIQDHAYRAAIEAEHPELAGRVEMIFLFAQTVEPFAVTPIVCGNTMREIGCGRWRRAVETWNTCLRTGRWPSYTTHPIQVEAPSWAMHLEMQQGESE